ncbi:MAG: sigma-70 family RNA polymerase sigma factor [Nannocystaceae bacterium]|nr:sigma-70 family RNA polymerase sigma factor [Nannocystaceae bacterium]
MADDDPGLLTRAQAGDRAALEQLVERQQARVHRFAAAMCRDGEDAKDVVQETLLALARNVATLQSAAALSTWLYTVARSFCIKKQSRHGRSLADAARASEPDAAAALADPARPPDEAAAARELARALAGAIESLEPGTREVVVLRDVEGLTAPEVAQVLGISAQAVKSRLHRGRVAVRDLVAPLLQLPAAEAAAGTCPDVLTLFSQHLEDEIDAGVCAQMERHLEGCPRCRVACDSLKRSLALCRTAGARDEVPPQVQAAVRRAMRGLLDGA